MRMGSKGREFKAWSGRRWSSNKSEFPCALYIYHSLWAEEIPYAAVITILEMELAWNAWKVILGDIVHRAPIRLMDICADLPVLAYNTFVTMSMDVQNQRFSQQ